MLSEPQARWRAAHNKPLVNVVVKCVRSVRSRSRSLPVARARRLELGEAVRTGVLALRLLGLLHHHSSALALKDRFRRLAVNERPVAPLFGRAAFIIYCAPAYFAPLGLANPRWQEMFRPAYLSNDVF